MTERCLRNVGNAPPCPGKSQWSVDPVPLGEERQMNTTTRGLPPSSGLSREDEQETPEVQPLDPERQAQEEWLETLAEMTWESEGGAIKKES
jgi:hypothetical protein